MSKNAAAITALQEGKAAYKTGCYDTAVEYFSQFIALEPDAPLGYKSRANAYAKIGRIRDGMRDAKILVQLLPDHHTGYLTAASLCRKTGNAVKAKAFYLEALKRLDAEKEKSLHEMIVASLAKISDEDLVSQFSPISSLPADIFLIIIAMATKDPLVDDKTPVEECGWYCADEKTLLSALRVSKSWKKTVQDYPPLWDSLFLDGNLQDRKLNEKLLWWISHSRGRGSLMRTDSPSNSALRRMVLRNMSDSQIITVMEQCRQVGVTPRLTEVFLSSQHQITAGQIPQICLLISHLIKGNASSLQRFRSVTGGRLGAHSEDIYNIFNQFPKLRVLNLSTTKDQTNRPVLRSFSIPESKMGATSKDMFTNARVLVLQQMCLTNPLDFQRFPNLKSVSLRLQSGSSDDGIVQPSCQYQYFHLDSDPLSLGQTASWLGKVNENGSVTQYEESFRQINTLRLNNIRTSRGGARDLVLFISLVLMPIVPLPPLRLLDLSGCLLDHLDLNLCLEKFSPTLEELYLQNTRFSSAYLGETLALPNLPRLKVLDLTASDWVTDNFTKTLAALTPVLERLRLTDNNNVTGRPIMELVQSRRQFIDINRINDFALRTPLILLSPSCSDVAAADNVRKTGSATDTKGSHTDLEIYSQFVELNIDNCTRITSDAIRWIKKHVKPQALVYRSKMVNSRSAIY